MSQKNLTDKLDYYENKVEGENGVSQSSVARNDWAMWWQQQTTVDIQYRLREVEQFLSAAGPILTISADDEVLDIGCGPGFLADYIASQVREYHGADISLRDVELGRERLRESRNVFFHALDPTDYTNLGPLPDKKFSLMFCLSVLQYYRDLADVENLLTELKQYAAPRARLLITDMPIERNTLRETLGIVNSARRQRRLLQTCWQMLQLSFSDYRGLRRHPGLLHFSRPEVLEMLTRIGLEWQVIDRPITPLVGRLHLLVQFP